MLADLADEAIIPAYRQFDSAAAALHAAAARLCDAPGEDALADARTALDASPAGRMVVLGADVGGTGDGPALLGRGSLAGSAVDEIEELIADTSHRRWTATAWPTGSAPTSEARAPSSTSSTPTAGGSTGTASTVLGRWPILAAATICEG